MAVRRLEGDGIFLGFLTIREGQFGRRPGARSFSGCVGRKDSAVVAM
jgi:hypothetical protein